MAENPTPIAEGAAHILVVDDDDRIRTLLKRFLTEHGFRTSMAADAKEARRLMGAVDFDLLILDVMMPELSGTEICRQVRGTPELADLPIIMLTAKAEELDRVVGLELGADDYVTKPFSPRELALRVKAVLRRGRAAAGEGRVLEKGELRVDLERHRCFVKDAEVDLTSKEFALLSELMARPGRVLSRDQLLDRVWGSDIVVTSRTIDTHLKRLREKLGVAGPLIETVRGVGYRFAE